MGTKRGECNWSMVCVVVPVYHIIDTMGGGQANTPSTSMARRWWQSINVISFTFVYKYGNSSALIWQNNKQIACIAWTLPDDLIWLFFKCHWKTIRFLFLFAHKFVDCIWQMAFALISFVFVFSLSPRFFVFVFCCKCYLVIVDFRVHLNGRIPYSSQMILDAAAAATLLLSNSLVVSIIRF